MFTSIVREEAAQYGVSFKSLAKAVNVAPSTMSLYISGDRNMPREVEAGIIEELQSPRLSEERCFHCQGNMFPTRYLDNADDHPIVALDRVEQEALEFIESVRRAKEVMCNKPRGARFTPEEEQIILCLEDENADLITGAKTVLIRLQEWFGRPVRDTMHRHVEKLERNGYCTKRKSPRSCRRTESAYKTTY